MLSFDGQLLEGVQQVVGVLELEIELLGVEFVEVVEVVEDRFHPVQH